ncbi:hypothetical protein RTH46_02150 [Pseudomonas sp. zfem004]|uniref:hypothetical protein n=1 Tax=unclassified Pseudomonas TaxID=196821 RepID=UPI00129B7C36|nr:MULTISPECIES: hypothetical protein [unclassified Pseudomonas]MDU9401296.1 hypothetical protein [Pseudomonas sp. zfem004]
MFRYIAANWPKIGRPARGTAAVRRRSIARQQLTQAKVDQVNGTEQLKHQEGCMCLFAGLPANRAH